MIDIYELPYVKRVLLREEKASIALSNYKPEYVYDIRRKPELDLGLHRTLLENAKMASAVASAAVLSAQEAVKVMVLTHLEKEADTSKEVI